jgi:hypothetical protein
LRFAVLKTRSCKTFRYAPEFGYNEPKDQPRSMMRITLTSFAFAEQPH